MPCLNRGKEGSVLRVDGIGYIFLKNLPQNWILYLNSMFNKILTSESVLECYGKLKNYMLFKGGSIGDPDDHRRITLVNNVAKAFTQVICDRLVSWATKLNLIPKSQSGFRKGYSYLDNLFSLNWIIQLYLSKPNTVAYVIFVDFKGALPFVCHQLLRHKLHKLGLSSRIIISFYDSADA